MLLCLIIFFTSIMMLNASNFKPDYIDEKKFEAYAKKQQVITDKVTAHKYQQMYGLFLMPLLHQAKHLNQCLLKMY